MINAVKLVFSQCQFPDKKPKIELEYYEKTDLDLDRTKLKIWTSAKLLYWYKTQVLQKKRTFNLRKPIKIEIYWNGKLELLLMQKRVIKDTIIRKNKDFPFQLKNCVYILGTYRDSSVPKKLAEEINIKTYEVNTEKLFNTIAYYTSEHTKYGTPIIYTGMTN